jgi:hypothetical protein
LSILSKLASSLPLSPTGYALKIGGENGFRSAVSLVDKLIGTVGELDSHIREKQGQIDKA